jgi:hypothetical protein
LKVGSVIVILQVGQALASAVDSTAAVVVRAPAADVAITCGGPAMVVGSPHTTPAVPDPAQQSGSLLGKRYVADDIGLELLCTKAGAGTLAVDGVPLRLKEATPLPASD